MIRMRSFAATLLLAACVFASIAHAQGVEELDSPDLSWSREVADHFLTTVCSGDLSSSIICGTKDFQKNMDREALNDIFYGVSLVDLDLGVAEEQPVFDLREWKYKKSVLSPDGSEARFTGQLLGSRHNVNFSLLMSKDQNKQWRIQSVAGVLHEKK